MRTRQPVPTSTSTKVIARPAAADRPDPALRRRDPPASAPNGGYTRAGTGRARVTERYLILARFRAYRRVFACWRDVCSSALLAQMIQFCERRGQFGVLPV